HPLWACRFGKPATAKMPTRTIRELTSFFILIFSSYKRTFTQLVMGQGGQNNSLPASGAREGPAISTGSESSSLTAKQYSCPGLKYAWPAAANELRQGLSGNVHIHRNYAWRPPWPGKVSNVDVLLQSERGFKSDSTREYQRIGRRRCYRCNTPIRRHADDLVLNVRRRVHVPSKIDC